MPKKHRVKRQKYVEYLRKLEKERDAYLSKRKNAKRNRQARLADENMGDARERAEVLPPQKRHRTEAGTSSTSIVNQDIDSSSGSKTLSHLSNGAHRENDQYDSSTITNIKKEETKILEKNSALGQETVEAAKQNTNTTHSSSSNSHSSNDFFSTNANILLQSSNNNSANMTANIINERKNVELSNRVKKTIRRRY